MNQTIDLLMSHMSIRKFKEIEVSEDILHTIIEAAQWSATSSHYQAYTIIDIRDNNKRQILADIAGGQTWVVKSPVFLVFCADLFRGNKYWKNTKTEIFGNTELLITATVDAALAAQKAFIAAQALGLGGVYVGGIRNDLARVSELLELPELVYPVFGMCLGYPAEDPGQKPRLPLEVIYKVDKYEESNDAAGIASYEKVMEQYYEGRSIKDTWCERSGRYMMRKTRDEVSEFLKNKGFNKR